ncbi:MAG TPA: M56 family metallopeptidase [Rhizomicrobium sp.]|jgi:beta-lactamase regulating signal transducer with metallopeptidase domain|nr:M56 family metallopeptidase [Rhizomicrobium sp.]
MTELIALRALLFAGELLAGSAVILSFAWGLAAQRSASARHLTWAGAFGALLALPVLMAIFPSAFHLLLPAPPRLPLVQTFDVVEMAALPAPPPGGFSFDAPNIALALGTLWIAGVCAAAARLTVAAFCLSALRRRSRLFALPPQALPKVTATHRECELRLSERDVGPIAWGLFRPVILLPESATVWPRDRLHSALLHELAHIRRRDWAVQALAHLVCALYWPNPLVWIGAKNLRREAEIAADDAVIVSGVRPSSYAGELLELAAEFRVRRPLALANMALFMAELSALEARVESVLAPTSLRTGVTSMDVVKIASAGLFAAAAIAFACPSLAQDAQTAPVTTAPLAPSPPDAPPPPGAPRAGGATGSARASRSGGARGFCCSRHATYSRTSGFTRTAEAETYRPETPAPRSRKSKARGDQASQARNQTSRPRSACERGCDARRGSSAARHRPSYGKCHEGSAGNR